MQDLLQPRSLDELESLAEEPAGGALLVLACRFPDLASAAARTYARLLLGGRDALADLHVFAPSEGRWRVGDLEPVVQLTRSTPRQLHVVVLEEAWAMDPRLHDRLLLLLEEPHSPSLFILCLRRSGELPATLRGRAWRDLTLEPLERSERIAGLVAAGAAQGIAAQAVGLAGSLVTVAGPLARSNDARTLARAALAPDLDPGTPLQAALGRLGQFEELAGMLVDLLDDDARSDTKSLAKALLELWLEHRRRAAVQALRDGAGSEVVAAELAAQDMLRKRLSVPVGQALAVGEFCTRVPKPVRRSGRTAGRGG